MFLAEPLAVIVAAPVDKPAHVVVVSRDAHSDILVGTDTPLPLIKGRKTEDERHADAEGGGRVDSTDT